MDNTRFVDEIRNQPSALRAAADFYTTGEGAGLLARSAEMIGSRQRLVFTGMGTSLYAPYLIVKELDGLLPSIELRDAGELLHFGLKGLHDDTILAAVSQSGESAETRNVVQKAAGKVPILSIVNNPASFMGRNADLILPLHAGEEASISAKTYTNTLAVLLLLSSALRKESLSEVTGELSVTADIMERNLDVAYEAARSAVRFFGTTGTLHCIARGSDLVTAHQWALILKEGAGLFTEALSAGLFRHGPIELAGEGHAAACIVSTGNEPDLTASLAAELCSLGSRVLVLSYRSGERLPVAPGMMEVRLDSPSPRYFPIMCAPFIELFVHEAAMSRGREAGVFRHATKITSRE